MKTTTFNQIVQRRGQLDVLSIVDIIQRVSCVLPEEILISRQDVSQFSEGRISISIEFNYANDGVKRVFALQINRELARLSKLETAN